MPSDQDLLPPHTTSIHRSGGDERQHSLAQAAFEIIAERGLEGLRTREVAARAHANVALVHYYFAGKNDLIRGVVDYLATQFMTFRAPPVFTGEGTAVDHLRQEFADARYYQEEMPQVNVVFQELSLRAHRDPNIQPMFTFLERNRYADIERIVLSGMDAGLFRANLDVAVTVNLIIAMLGGASFGVVPSFDYDKTYDELLRWLSPKAGYQIVPMWASSEP